MQQAITQMRKHSPPTASAPPVDPPPPDKPKYEIWRARMYDRRVLSRVGVASTVLGGLSLAAFGTGMYLANSATDYGNAAGTKDSTTGGPYLRDEWYFYRGELGNKLAFTGLLVGLPALGLGVVFLAFEVLEKRSRRLVIAVVPFLLLLCPVRAAPTFIDGQRPAL